MARTKSKYRLAAVKYAVKPEDGDKQNKFFKTYKMDVTEDLKSGMTEQDALEKALIRVVKEEGENFMQFISYKIEKA